MDLVEFKIPIMRLCRAYPRPTVGEHLTFLFHAMDVRRVSQYFRKGRTGPHHEDLPDVPGLL